MGSRVVVAPDKFKGSLTAEEAAEAMAAGLRAALPWLEVDTIPVADGGEGTLSAALAAGYDRVPVIGAGPTGEDVATAYARKEDVAVVEMADVAGLHLLPGGRMAPMGATSRGLGQVVAAALADGCTHITIGIGGSACTDGGAGLLQALGARLWDEHGEAVGDGGGSLVRVDRVDLDALNPLLATAQVVIASDVDNPLCGPDGAAYVYGPQKGADPVQVRQLDDALSAWADAVAAATGRDLRAAKGAGAAGGVGFAAMAVLGGELRAGADLILELVDLPSHLDGATAVITGEGSLDGQSLSGKAPVGVAAMARRHGVPVFGVAGTSLLTRAEEIGAGFSAVYALSDREPVLATSMANAASLLEGVVAELAREQLPQLLGDLDLGGSPPRASAAWW